MQIFINGKPAKNKDVLIVFDIENEEGEAQELHIVPTDEGLVFDVYQKGKVVKSTYDFSQEIADKCVCP